MAHRGAFHVMRTRRCIFSKNRHAHSFTVKMLPGKCTYDYHDTEELVLDHKSKKGTEQQAHRVNSHLDCETDVLRLAGHYEPCLSELVGSWHSTSWLQAEPEDTQPRAKSSLSSVDIVTTATVCGSSGSSPRCLIGDFCMGQAQIAQGAGSRQVDSASNTQEQCKEPSSFYCNMETPQYSRYLVYRYSDTSAQPFQTSTMLPTPSDLHTDDSEWSVGPGTPGRVSHQRRSQSELKGGRNC